MDLFKNVRKVNNDYKGKPINFLIFMLLGVLLGIFSKWLDNLSIDDTIWYQHIIGLLDLRNVFSEISIWLLFGIIISVNSKSPTRAAINSLLFFAGMSVSYHLYTIYICHFNPSNYMIFWYIMSILSAPISYICWYSKSDGIISTVISSLLISVMIICCFSMGRWYFDLKSVVDLLIFVLFIITIHTSYKKTIYSILISIVITFIYCCILDLPII